MACLIRRSWLLIQPAKVAQVVGVEGRNRALGIFLRPAERAVPVPLEHHDEIGPHAPGRERGAEILRHGAEVLADGDAVPAPALLGDHRQHVGERQAQVGALGGAEAHAG